MPRPFIKPIILLRFAFFFLLSTISPDVFSQTPFDGQVLLSDSLGKSPNLQNNRRRPRTKRFGLALTQWGMGQMAPFILDRYITKKDYAYISIKSVKYNLKLSNWEFDNDVFQTNQFGHPYHGSQFYSAFRANGYNFWQSAPAVLVGSYVWETFAENQAPSTNDFINTSFGGIVLGEMTYRFSNRLIDPRVGGFKRQVREVMAFIVNPMNGFQRIVTGKWGKVNLSARQDTSKVNAEFDLGVRQFSTNRSDGKFGWYGRVKLLYGTPYVDYTTPFSNVYASVEVGNDDSSKVNVISVYGSLAGWKIRSNEKLMHLAILSANYDYLNNEAFFYSAQSVKLNIFSEYRPSTKIKINTTVGAGPVLLAAVPNEFPIKGRNYDYASGASVLAGGGIDIAGHFFASIDYRGSWLKTINGNASHYFLHAATSEFRYQFKNGFSVAAEPGYFTLEAYYKNSETINKKYPFLRLSAKYNVKL